MWILIGLEVTPDELTLVIEYPSHLEIGKLSQMKLLFKDKS